MRFRWLRGGGDRRQRPITTTIQRVTDQLQMCSRTRFAPMHDLLSWLLIYHLCKSVPFIRNCLKYCFCIENCAIGRHSKWRMLVFSIQSSTIHLLIHLEFSWLLFRIETLNSWSTVWSTVRTVILGWLQIWFFSVCLLSLTSTVSHCSIVASCTLMVRLFEDTWIHPPIIGWRRKQDSLCRLDVFFLSLSSLFHDTPRTFCHFPSLPSPLLFLASFSFHIGLSCLVFSVSPSSLRLLCYWKHYSTVPHSMTQFFLLLPLRIHSACRCPIAIRCFWTLCHFPVH